MIHVVSKNSTIIAKFGGTSVSDFTAMNRCVDLVLTHPQVRLVVLSASNGITNLLLNLAKGYDTKNQHLQINAIRQIQYTILNSIKESSQSRQKIDQMLENISVLSKAAALATSPALIDELVSYGELMSTILFVDILRSHNIRVKWFDVRQVMRTDDQFGRAVPDRITLYKLSQTLLKPYLERGLVVTQGFIGREPNGRTTTLGRGGSDYTAALLGEALHAKQIDIWTDVPGIYTTDPRLVPLAKRIDKMTFEEAAEMASFGAKVLHPATLLPAVRGNIPVFVGSSKEPTAGGTLVCKTAGELPRFRALALRYHQTLLTLHSFNTLHSRNFLDEVFTIFKKNNIFVDLITTSEVSMAITMDATRSTSTDGNLITTSLLTELSDLCRTKVEENLALVTLIGNKLSQGCGVGQEVFSVLDPFNIRMILYGASNYNLCFLLPGDDAVRVVRALHRNLFE